VLFTLPCARRAKEYAEAVERYTISLGYRPANAALHANRAAAYIKLKVR